MRITRALRAFFRAVSKEQPVVVVVTVLTLLGIVALAYLAIVKPKLFVESPRQEQQRAAENKRWHAERAAADENTKRLCALKSKCAKYGRVRQECAVAGDFQNCLQIRMGDVDLDAAFVCTGEGKPMIPESQIPGPVSCFQVSHSEPP
jgi:hypothetical protein